MRIVDPSRERPRNMCVPQSCEVTAVTGAPDSCRFYRRLAHVGERACRRPPQRWRRLLLNQVRSLDNHRSVCFCYAEQMPRGEFLGSLEQIVMLAVVRLGSDAYGMTVRREIEERTGREISIGAVL